MSAVSDDPKSKAFISDLEECLAYVQKRQKKSGKRWVFGGHYSPVGSEDFSMIPGGKGGKKGVFPPFRRFVRALLTYFLTLGPLKGLDRTVEQSGPVQRSARTGAERAPAPRRRSGTGNGRNGPRGARSGALSGAQKDQIIQGMRRWAQAYNLLIYFRFCFSVVIPRFQNYPPCHCAVNCLFCVVTLFHLLGCPINISLSANSMLTCFCITLLARSSFATSIRFSAPTQPWLFPPAEGNRWT